MHIMNKSINYIVAHHPPGAVIVTVAIIVNVRHPPDGDPPLAWEARLMKQKEKKKKNKNPDDLNKVLHATTA